MAELLHKDLTYYLRGLGFRIHKALGGGHPEAHYETAVTAGLEADHVPFLRQHTYYIYYRNQQIGEYRPDFTLANGAVQLDLKATPQITSLHQAQLLSYLAVTNAELGFIMNFGGRSMQYDRLPNFLSSRQRSPMRRPVDPTLLYPALTNQVLDALYTVHFTLGTGFWHKVYRRATRIELAHVGVPFLFLRELPLTYAGQFVAMRPTRLMVVDQKVLLATVALDRITATHTEKLRWAQRETGCRLAILANFAPTQLDVRFLRI
ncbi:MAG: GxxExxY protein [Caldilinea sp. CFX5]|nr:GxxExxY protein [Caldilinea sp. CFX5]